MPFGYIICVDFQGGSTVDWELFLFINDSCIACVDYNNCQMKKKHCPLLGFQNFHKRIMPSGEILKYAISQIMENTFSIIAPQHGSIIHKSEDIKFLSNMLMNLEGVGIDSVLKKKDK